MKDLIRKCSKMADYVVIDTPPMSMVSDAEAIVDLADFSMLVIRAGLFLRKDIIDSINVMNDSNSKFLGCVLNDYKVIRVKDKKQYV